MNRREFLTEGREEIERKFFPSFAWPGGYTIIYYDELTGDTFCGSCALQVAIEQFDGCPCKIHQMVYDEGPVVHCVGCNKAIESSYGDVE